MTSDQPKFSGNVPQDLSQRAHRLLIGILGLLLPALLAFILFSIWLFRKSSVPRRRDRPLEKQWRDAGCLLCGLVMIGCVLWAASSLITHAPIFLPEAIAIVAFAISWLVKGEAYQPLLRAIRRLSAKTAVQ